MNDELPREIGMEQAIDDRRWLAWSEVENGEVTTESWISPAGTVETSTFSVSEINKSEPARSFSGLTVGVSVSDCASRTSGWVGEGAGCKAAGSGGVRSSATATSGVNPGSRGGNVFGTCSTGNSVTTSGGVGWVATAVPVGGTFSIGSGGRASVLLFLTSDLGKLGNRILRTGESCCAGALFESKWAEFGETAGRSLVSAGKSWTNSGKSLTSSSWAEAP